MKRRRGVKVERQRHEWDCGVACLSMLLDKPYGDVAAVVRDRVKAARRRGLSIDHMQLVSGLLGVELEARRRKAGYLDGQTGILWIVGEKVDPTGHWVVIKSGAAIVDPWSSRVWTVADYMAEHVARPWTLLVEAA